MRQEIDFPLTGWRRDLDFEERYGRSGHRLRAYSVRRRGMSITLMCDSLGCTGFITTDQARVITEANSVRGWGIAERCVEREVHSTDASGPETVEEITRSDEAPTVSDHLRTEAA